MAISIHTNLMAGNAARTLGSHYDRLSKSVQRLSSGLRINSAADDAAGLAIRELMRADVSTLNQGIRNANDAISMIQTADGALAVIDEKLIRMKELAEQAATGTYNSTPRLMIDSEFQAMGAEIDRIARATDFNGIHLLDGSLAGEHDGSGLNAAGAMKIHFGTGNASAEDYYYVEMGDCTTGGLGLRTGGYGNGSVGGINWFDDPNVSMDYTNKKIILDISSRLAGPQDNSPAAIPTVNGMDYYTLPIGLENITITSDVANSTYMHKPHVNLFINSGKQLTGITPDEEQYLSKLPPRTLPGKVWWGYLDLNDKDTVNKVMSNLKASSLLKPDAQYDGNDVIGSVGESITTAGMTVSMKSDRSEQRGEEHIEIDRITSDLVFMIGGCSFPSSRCNEYVLKIEADVSDELMERIKGAKGDLVSIKIQEAAQNALETIDDAIVKKDQVRAHLGALQNRLENTVTNLSIQAENLQASESRISDTDVATEMTAFVRNQILTQSAVSMLSQANSLPQMLTTLLR